MPDECAFGLFTQDEKGPLYRGFFDNLESAKKAAQENANKEGLEFVVYSFRTYAEVGRFKPKKTDFNA